MTEPCIQFGTAALALYGALAGCTALLIVAYLISITRKARLGDRAEQVFGSQQNAYEEMHRIEQENVRLDALIKRGMRVLAAEQFRQRRSNYNDTEGEGA